MKLIKESNGNFIITDDNGVCRQIVRSDEVIDGDKLTKYQQKAAKMDGKKLLELYTEMVLVSFGGDESKYPDFEIMSECLTNEIMKRLS